MSEELNILIPTKGRCNNVTTNVLNQKLIVDKDEVSLYKEYNKDTEIIECPNFNNLSKKRNWIVNKFGDVFMLDDDIIVCHTLIDEYKELNPKEQFDIIKKQYYLSKDLGIYLYGFNNDPSPVHFNAMKPIVLKGFINGCAIGINKGGKLFFDENIIAAEDYIINLLNSYVNRINIIDKRFCFKQRNGSTFLDKGGQSNNRTLLTEKKDNLYLRFMFGESIQIKKERNVKKGGSPFSRQLKIRL